MRIVSVNDNKLVVQNSNTSIVQARWASFVLALGCLRIYYLAGDIVGNLIYFWAGILFHVLCFLLTCWYFAPVVSTFDKIKNTVTIEKNHLFNTKFVEHNFSEITNIHFKQVSPINIFSVIGLGLTCGKQLYLSNSWENHKPSQQVLQAIKFFYSK